MSTLLSVRNLQVRYPLAGTLLPFINQGRPSHVDVVRGVSFDIRRGETMAVVGESGSGKTTLALALCGLAPIKGGAVSFDGRLRKPGKDRRLHLDRKRIALMFQDPVASLSPRMTVQKLLAEPFHIHRTGAQDPDREAQRLLSLVGLSHEFAARYPHQLSGGQARRVAMARALALNPDLLIADEPTAGLDVSVQGEVLNLLCRVQKERGLGVMIITHNLNIVRHVADRMAIMYLGRFVEQGLSERIFHQPAHPYTAALLSANPKPDPDAEQDRIELKGEIPGLLWRTRGCEFHTRCPRAQADCRRSFPHTTGSVQEQAFRCFHPLG